jgi:proteasome accessory factor C
MSEQATLLRTLKMLMLLNHNFGRNVEELASLCGDINPRTVYRYINTLRDVGFVIEKVNNKYYRVSRHQRGMKLEKLLHFSEEESFLLNRAIHRIESEGDDSFRSKLIDKLYSLYDFKRVARAITRPEDTDNILNLLNAITEKKQVILKNYHSANSGTILNRLVEPIGFTYHYSSLWAFDTHDHQNKLFRTSRFSSVDVLDTAYQYPAMHKMGETDVFRMAGFQTTAVKLTLSMRAYSLLIEEYPMAEKFARKTSDQAYVLETRVCDMAGIGRFVLSLPGEITIVRPQALKDYVKEKITEYTV